MISSNTSNYFQKHVLIFSSSTDKGNASCLFKDECSWVSENIKNSSITIALLKNKFVLTSYSIAVNKGYCSPKEWVIEGYDSNGELHQISYRNTLMCTNRYSDGTNQVCNANSPTYHVVDKRRPFSFLKITHIGERQCTGNKYIFPLAKIVFEGYFSKDHTICNRRKSYNFQIYLVLVL